MIKNQKHVGYDLSGSPEEDLYTYGSSYTQLSIEEGSYKKMERYGIVHHAASPSCVPSFGSPSSLGYPISLGTPGSIISFFGTHPSFVIREKDHEIALLKETIVEMKRRLDLLERHYGNSPVHVRVVNIHDKPLDEIYDVVLEYYNSHAVAYPDDVADALGLNLRKVIEVVDKLIAEGKIEVAT